MSRFGPIGVFPTKRRPAGIQIGAPSPKDCLKTSRLEVTADAFAVLWAVPFGNGTADKRGKSRNSLAGTLCQACMPAPASRICRRHLRPSLTHPPNLLEGGRAVCPDAAAQFKPSN